MLTLTDSAAAKLLELLAEHEPEESVLRLYVKPGGCTGFSYGMALDTPQPTDQRLTLKGVPIAIDRDSVELLAGSEVDYV
ncbi:MAG: iron-sulfur cluster assembly accessory protein, partial [Alicyclobacillus sp.]|nr:iron-sulfur cluster assembly accessory protein [Alicyclobacillus sp.]